jgi:hypothetical protein
LLLVMQHGAPLLAVQVLLTQRLLLLLLRQLPR